MRRLIPVILSGGSGTRLWPLSRELKPKQLLPLVTERTLLQDTLLRIRELSGNIEPPIVVCNEAHRFVVAEQLREIGVAAQTIVLEPAGRNTAPATAVAALAALGEIAAKAAPTSSEPSPGSGTGGSGFGRDLESDPILIVLPADHVILGTKRFVAAVRVAIEVAEQGWLVTFGIVPDRPETGYGYLHKGGTHGAWSELERFVEKPDAATAQGYVESGEYLWNSGMFVLGARAYLGEVERVAPRMLDQCRAALGAAEKDADFTRLSSAFLECPADSIDYAVMEKTRSGAVVPLAAGWSDVGSWAALYDVLAKDKQGNVLKGDVVLDGCRNSYVAATSRLVAVIGLEGVVVVETDDAVLVMDKKHAQRVKNLVDALRARPSIARGSGSS